MTRSLVRKYILNPSQREAVEKFLRDLPDKTPDQIRQIRWVISGLDLDQMQQDLNALKELKELNIPIGRVKKKGWADQRVVFIVRHEGTQDAKAVMNVKQKGGK